MHNYADTYAGYLMCYEIDDTAFIAATLSSVYPPVGQARFWFGNVNYNEPNLTKQFDFTRGPLAPFMETNYAAFQCPDFGSSQVDVVRFGKMACGYGFNGYYLGWGTNFTYPPPNYSPSLTPDFHQLRDVVQMTNTVVFADCAQVKNDYLNYPNALPSDLTFQESWLMSPPSQNFPTIHFRHTDTANVAFMDGHVESRTRTFSATAAVNGGIAPLQATMMDAKRLGYVTDGTLNYSNVQDTLYQLYPGQPQPGP